ncbi:MAG: CPBP family intramembrane glutamic endopeptidase [Pirellulaceae bacterium]
MQSPEHEPDTAPNITAMAVAFEGGLILLALVLGWLFSVDPVATMRGGVGHLAVQGWAALWGVAATGPMLVLLLAADRYPVGPLRGLKQAVDDSILPLFEGTELAALAILSLLAGVGEEMLFRGFLQPAIAGWTGETPWSVAVGVGVSALVFGLCHAITRTYFLAATLIGVYFGLLLLWTDSLLAPIVAHALYDFVALAYMLHWRKR